MAVSSAWHALRCLWPNHPRILLNQSENKFPHAECMLVRFMINVLVSIMHNNWFYRRASQHIKMGTIQSTTQNRLEREPMPTSYSDELKTQGVSNDSLSASNYSMNSAEHLKENQKSTNGSVVTVENHNDTPPNMRQKLTVFAAKIIRSSSSKTLDKRGSSPKPASEALLKKERHLRKLRNNRGRERRATVTIAIIVFGFVICWLPFSTLYLIDKLCNCGIKEHPAFTVIFWLGYCNSAINPVLYSIFNRDFRQAFHRLLCNGKRRSSY